MNSRKNIITVIFVFIIFLLPVLSIISCEGWSTSDGQVKSCVLNLGIIKYHSIFYYFLLFIRAISMVTPLFVYFIIGLFIILLCRYAYDHGTVLVTINWIYACSWDKPSCYLSTFILRYSITDIFFLPTKITSY